MNKIWAIILAAGESKRMGFPKMLLDFGGKTMLERVIENTKGSDVDEIMVVLGADNDKLKSLISNLSVSFCYNENYKEGMLSSVKCGFRNIPDGYKAVLVFQGDQPYIKADVINSLIRAYRSSGYGLLMPVFNGRRGHPLLIDHRYNDEIELLDSSEGLRSLSRKFSKDVLEVETADSGILRDFDTYAEYKSDINQKL
jgi:molybdenum cofactor cytidylyltransferase